MIANSAQADSREGVSKPIEDRIIATRTRFQKFSNFFEMAAASRKGSADAGKATYTVETDKNGRRRMGKIVIGYLAVMNLMVLAVMEIDKEKAIRHAWRIPEKVLFGVSLLGGSIGTWLGMYLFRHKTKHWYFVIGMPLILIVQTMVAIMVMY